MPVDPRLLDELAAADPDDAAWTRFDASPEPLRRAVVTALKARVDALVRSAPPEALPLAERLVRAARDVPALEAIALRGRAVAAHFAGRLDDARADFERAAALHDQAGERVELARVLRSLVDVHQLSGRTDEALRCADRARAILDEAGEARLLAQLEVNVGNVFTRLDDYPRARECYQRARDAFASLDDSLGTSFAEFNLAVVEMNSNRCAEAERAAKAARVGLDAAGMLVPVADCDYHLAYLASRRGRFAEAIEGLERARETYEANGKPSGPPLCDLDLAEIMLRLDARRDARERADRAAARFDELGLRYEQARAEVLGGLARARLGEAAAARELLLRASARLAELGNTSYAAAVAVILAELEVDAGRPDDALWRLETSESVLGERGLVLLADLARMTHARALLDLGDARGALERLDALVAPRSEDGLLDDLVHARALRLAADAHAALGQRDDALARLRDAVRLIEHSYAQVPGRDARVAFLRDRHEAFTDLSWWLAERGDDGEALTVLERSRSRSLAEAPRPSGGDDEMSGARERLDWLLARRLDDELGPAGGDHDLRRGVAADDEIRAAQRDVARHQRASKAGERAGSGLSALELDDLREARRGDELLLAYLTTRRGVRVFVVDHDGVASRPLDIDESRLRALRQRLVLHTDKLRLGRDYVRRREGALLAASGALLSELGRCLLGPVADRLGDGRPLVVIPFGELHDLPFHAFVHDGAPLVSRHEVGYGLSTWSLARIRARPARTGEARLLVTGVDHPGLPGIPREVEALKALYGARLEALVPGDLPSRLAAMSALDDVAGSAPSVLHVAGHGLFESAHPVFSAVCLGDTFLLAHDVRSLSLPFDLVTLSGCETGRKGRVPGDELLGLPRAFREAGARATLGSLWPVDDLDAHEFCRLFYTELATGASARQAVTRAQRNLMDVRPHPFAWGAFALLGDPDVRCPA
ncbi:MAG: CHAT domain-containing protein [Planctomycetes bacterium]|nr:CHAT domain-containing protein [Planctomycetota bacterium]